MTVLLKFTFYIVVVTYKNENRLGVYANETETQRHYELEVIMGLCDCCLFLFVRKHTYLVAKLAGDCFVDFPFPLNPVKKVSTINYIYEI